MAPTLFARTASSSSACSSSRIMATPAAPSRVRLAKRGGSSALRAMTMQRPSSAPSVPAPQQRVSLLTQISAVVEHEAMVQRFERMAGRSAMLGVSVALLLEGVGGSPVVAGSDSALALAAALLVVTSSSAVALMRKRTVMGGLLLEAVTASLTSTSRAAGNSLTLKPNSGSRDGLDAIVDYVMDSVIDEKVTASLQSSSTEDEGHL